MKLTYDLQVTPCDAQEGSWILVRSFVHAWNNVRIVVPAGFVTDFASVPRLLWFVLPPFGRHCRAAVVHDWIYRSAWADGRTFVGGEFMTRFTADRMFLDVMREYGVGRVRRTIMFLGVRVGGWIAWSKYRRAGS